MNILFLIIGSACMSNLLAWGSGPIEWIKDKMNLPLDSSFRILINCEICLGFWIGVISTAAYFPLEASNLIGLIFTPFIISILSGSIKRIIFD